MRLCQFRGGFEKSLFSTRVTFIPARRPAGYVPKYLHSVRMPIRQGDAWYAPETNLLAVERDTTVVIYRVERPEH